MKWSSRDVATSGVFATLYVVLVYVFHPISFLQLQLRIANVLHGAVPIFGMPAVIGLSIGVLIANLPSPLGMWDWLSCIPTFIGLLIIYELSKLGDRWLHVGFVIYAATIGLWVSFILWITLGLNYMVSFVYIFISQVIVLNIFAYLFYKVLKKGLGVKK